jgi:hypothetical protein
MGVQKQSRAACTWQPTICLSITRHLSSLFSCLYCEMPRAGALSVCLLVMSSQKVKWGRPCPFSLIVQLPTTSRERAAATCYHFLLIFWIRTGMMARVLCVCVSLPRAWTSIYTHTGREILFKLINLARAGGGDSCLVWYAPQRNTSTWTKCP